MKLTSSQASKLLKTLTEEHANILGKERCIRTFSAFANEDIANIRPDYNYEEYQAKIAELEKQIRTLKHAINLFNTQTVLPDTDGMTIDSALVYMPQLTNRKTKLDNMASRLPKQRLQSDRTTTDAVSEFNYANYDVDKVKEDYDKTTRELRQLQATLDRVNSTVEFEVEL